MISQCLPLEELDYRPHLDCPLGELRKKLGIEVNLLESYYQIEARRNPKIEASQRLCA
jgi:hypothetical protein